jgi:prevent-host-death family protein
MPIIGLRQLSRETSDVIKELQNSGEPVVITKQGRPVATIMPVDETTAEDLVLGLAPSIREVSSTADVEAFSSERDRTIEEFSEQLAQEASRTADGRKALAEYERDRQKHRVELGAQARETLSASLDHLAGSGQLSGMTPALAEAWRDSVQTLIEGTMQAALESAAILQERVGLVAKPAKSARGGIKSPAKSAVSTASAAKRSGGKRKASSDTSKSLVSRETKSGSRTSRQSAARASVRRAAN